MYICTAATSCVFACALQLHSGAFRCASSVEFSLTQVSEGPLHVALQSVMSRNSTLEDVVRWARCLAEILKQACQLCSESAKAAYVEVSSRLQVSLVCCFLELHCCTLQDAAS